MQHGEYSFVGERERERVRELEKENRILRGMLQEIAGVEPSFCSPPGEQEKRKGRRWFRLKNLLCR